MNALEDYRDELYEKQKLLADYSRFLSDKEKSLNSMAEMIDGLKGQP